jgi:hypothetical protein
MRGWQYHAGKGVEGWGVEGRLGCLWDSESAGSVTELYDGMCWISGGEEMGGGARNCSSLSQGTDILTVSPVRCGVNALA